MKLHTNIIFSFILFTLFSTWNAVGLNQVLLFRRPSFGSSTVHGRFIGRPYLFVCNDSLETHLNVTHGFGISRRPEVGRVMSETTILYSLGRKIVVHDLEHNKQRAIDVGGKVRAVTSLQVCPRKSYLAISDLPNASGRPPQVSIIDLEAEKPKRLRTLVHVNENAEIVVTGSKYVDVDFSNDSKLVVAVTKANIYYCVGLFRTRRVGSMMSNMIIV